MNDQPTQTATNTAPIATSDGFISFPAAFLDAPPDLRNVLKIIHRPTVRDGAVGLEFATDAMVVDLSSVDADLFNANAVAVDCDLIKRLALEYPAELRQLIKEMQRGTSEGVHRALEITERIGLTESVAVKAGGGFFFLIVVIALGLGASGCGGAIRERASSASTTPKPPGDAGK
jgi:hypothetical protein